MQVKGGCGKSATAINLTAALRLLRRRVCLLDIDPNRSSCGYDWDGIGAHHATTCLDGLAGAIDGARVPITLIDTPAAAGWENGRTMAAVRSSTHIIIPVNSIAALEEGALDTEGYCVAEGVPLEQVRVLLSQYADNARQRRLETYARELFGCRVFSTRIRSSAGIELMREQKRTVWDVATGTARADYMNLAREVLKW